jgi:predicted phage terminase large subunit-like protein
MDPTPGFVLPNLPPQPLTPAQFAHEASGGLWRGAPHLDHMNRVMFEAAWKHSQGIRSNIIINAPPRHGKSMFLSQYYPAWWLCNFPNDQVLLAAYEATFAADWGTLARQAFDRMAPSYLGRDGKPLALSSDQAAAARWSVARHAGIMRTAGAGGPILGKGGDLIVIDDPCKNSEDALSEHFNEGLWNWWITTVRTRREPGSVVVIMMQRWLEDDLIGRLLEKAREGGDQWDLYAYKAICEDDDDILGRSPGQVLWPSQWPLAELEETRRNSPFWFAAQYQQDPRPKGGEYFKGEWFRGAQGERIVNPGSLPRMVEYCRFWDRGSLAGKGDWTVGVLIGRTQDNYFYVLDVERGRWSEHERNRRIIAVAQADARRYGHRVLIVTEQEGGSSGKDVAGQFVRMLAGFRARALPITGSKLDFNLLWAEQVEAGSVRLVRADWNQDFIHEHEGYDRAKHDDQVDAAAGAFSQVCAIKKSGFGASPTRGYCGKRAGDMRFGGRKTRVAKKHHKPRVR